MEFLIWVLIAIGIYLFIAAGFRALISIRALKTELDGVQVKLNGFEVPDVEFTSAQPSTAEDLPKLLRVRRSRARAKEQALEERRRRLLQRISSINIDKRSA